MASDTPTADAFYARQEREWSGVNRDSDDGWALARKHDEEEEALVRRLERALNAAEAALQPLVPIAAIADQYRKGHLGDWQLVIQRESHAEPIKLTSACVFSAREALAKIKAARNGK